MGTVAVSPRVVTRNAFGQFARSLEVGGARTVKEAVNRGADLSRAMAPVGVKPDPRTPKLKDSIEEVIVSSNAGYWRSTARHALATEKGGRDHLIVGNPHLRFWWANAGRMFVSAEQYYNEPGRVTVVNHPGNPAQPFLRPAYRMVMSEIMRIAKKNYPG